MQEHNHPERRTRRGRGAAWFVAGALALVFSLTPAGGVARSEASFVAVLAQTKTYLNILIDEWEKYSRILEDHMDKVTGILQPFNEIHAGVRELTDTRRLRGVYRMMDAYRASVSDPRCFLPGAPANCTFQRHFTPPELREIEMQARLGIADGRYTLDDLERQVFDPGQRRSVQEVLIDVAGVADPDVAVLQSRIERNVQRNRWQIRRLRSLSGRGRYAARNFQRWGPDETGVNRRLLSGPPGEDCQVDLDLLQNDGRGWDNQEGTHDDPTILDQALHVDCLGSANHVDSPLLEQAHLSEIEAKTLRVAGMTGLLEMAALEVEQQATDEAERMAAEEEIEEHRRSEVERNRRRLNCAANGGLYALVDANGACGTVDDEATIRQATERMLNTPITSW